jgi:hypothetical protein
MKILPIVVAASAASIATPVFACASCGCTLTADWLSQGLVAQPGTAISLRYDYVPQTDLRSGTRMVDGGAIPLPAIREVERYTDNHYATASIDRQFDSDWGLDFQLPFSYRPHRTVAAGDTDQSFSRTQGIGDVRLTARWQGFSTPGSINGIQFGLILPTGAFHQAFRAGPQQGQEVDRGLQPGTGTVQAMLGYYRYGKLARDLDYIVQVQGQMPLDRRDLYRPGASGQLSAGIHFTHWRGITPQLDLNFRAVARDSGANADRTNSGGEELYAAPGLIAGLGGRASLFATVQVPLYRRVNGFQLVPKYTVTAGLQYRL